MGALNSSEVNTKFLCLEVIISPSKMVCFNIELFQILDYFSWRSSVTNARDAFLCACLCPIWEFGELGVFDELGCRFEFLFGWL